MRHFIVSHPVTASALSVREAPAATALVTLGGFTQAGAAGRLRTAAGAIDLATIAAAANEHLRPAAGTQEEAAPGLHPRAPRDTPHPGPYLPSPPARGKPRHPV